MTAHQNYNHLILQSTAAVMDRALHVRIHPEWIEQLAHELLAESDWLTSKPEPDDQYTDLFTNDAEYAQWLLVLDSLNFSFWEEREETRWRWPASVSSGGRQYKGAIAFGESLRDAQARGIPLTTASYLEHMTPALLAEIIGGQGTLPMLAERSQVLNEIGRVLNHHYDGQITYLLKKAAGDVNRVMELLIRDFPSFRDRARLDDMTAHFYKRAQIFISDLWHAFGARSLGQFENIELLTAFADYKLPQLLRATGALGYSQELSEQVDNRLKINYGTREEIEIRAATVQAVELLRSKLTKLLAATVYTCRLDNCLWALSHEKEFESAAPHHRTRTIYY